MRRSLGALLLGLVLSLPLAAQTASAPSVTASPDLDRVRAALDKYRDPIAALGDGYLSTLVCVEFPAVAEAGHMAHPAGGMGVHFLNAGLIGPQVDSTKPQVLIYEPVGDSLKLVAAEWFVPLAASAQQPTLFGHGFDGPMEGHVPIMPASLIHWDLHVWLWKANPAGTFNSTNPALKCPVKAYTVQGSAHMVEHH
jgi:hypothetical protein